MLTTNTNTYPHKFHQNFLDISGSCGRPNKELKLCTIAVFLFASSQHLTTFFFKHVLPFRWTTRRFFLREVSPTPVIVQFHQQKYDSNISLF